jgi:hypothetical protein
LFLQNKFCEFAELNPHFFNTESFLVDLNHPHNPALGRSFHPKSLLKRFFSQLDKVFAPLPDHSANATVTLRVGFEPTYDGFIYVLLNLSM